MGYTFKNVILPLYVENDTINIVVYNNLDVVLNTTSVYTNI